jgi:dTDP-glucose 4,6-dehydratase
MTTFVTGGLGFIGSNFVHAHLKKHPSDTVVIIDNYSYAADSNNILGLHEDYRVIVKRCDIRNLP